MKLFGVEQILRQVTPKVAAQWVAGKNTSTGNAAMDEFLDAAEADQESWDLTVMCAFEATHPGMDGVLDRAAFEEWLASKDAYPATAALASARAGVWISPRDYQQAETFWRSVASA
jgi:hypothetical protein